MASRSWPDSATRATGSIRFTLSHHRQEKERKLKNPTNATKKIFNCRTPEQWKEFNAALEPFYEESLDPHIAIDLIVRALTSVSRETIREWLDKAREDGPPPAEPLPGDEWFEPKEELPDFLRD